MGYSRLEEIQGQLRAEGWLASDMTLDLMGTPFWVVLGHRGAESFRVESPSREEAWTRARDEARSRGPAPLIPLAPAQESDQAGASMQFVGAHFWVESVAFSPDGSKIAIGSGQPLQTDPAEGEQDFSVRVWDLETVRELQRFQGHTHWVMSVAFSPDGRRVLSGSYDNTLRLWDVETGRPLRVFKGHGDRIRGVGYAPDGLLALSGSYDRTVRLWDVETGRQVHSLEGHANWVTSVAFSPDSRQALSGGLDHTVRLWDLSGLGPGSSGASWLRSLKKLFGKRELARLQGHTNNVTSVAFSPDGRLALSGAIDKTVRLWDLASRQEVRCLRGHTRGVMSVAFSPDGRRALSGGTDQRVLLWDVATGEQLHCFAGHTGIVTSVAFAPNGLQVLTGSADKTIRLWNVPVE